MTDLNLWEIEEILKFAQRTHHFLTFLISYVKHFHILLSSKRCREVFKHPPIVAFRRTSNLRDILLSRLLTTLVYNRDHSAVDKIVLLVLTLLTFLHTIQCTFFSTGATCQIKSHIICNTKNLIYMIQCNRCHLQYIGETKRRLKDRFNEHRRSVDKN